MRPELGHLEPDVKYDKHRPVEMQVRLTNVPAADAIRSWCSALDILAVGIATDILERARAEAAEELGLSPAEVAAEPCGVAELARSHGQGLVGGAR
jgi:hypothetical protein